MAIFDFVDIYDNSPVVSSTEEIMLMVNLYITYVILSFCIIRFYKGAIS